LEFGQHLIYYKMKNTTLINLGYVLEVTCLIVAGFLSATGSWFSIPFLFVGIILSVVVGKEIATNAVDEYVKEKL